MKKLFFSILVVPFFANAQQVMLLDRNFKAPVTLVAEYSMELANNELYPLYTADVQILISKLEEVVQELYAINGQPVKEQFIKFGGVTFFLQPNKKEPQRELQLMVVSEIGNIYMPLQLISKDDSVKRARQKLLIFLDYLKNNLAVLHYYNKEKGDENNF